MRNKLFPFALILVFGLALSSCGSDREEESSGSPVVAPSGEASEDDAIAEGAVDETPESADISDAPAPASESVPSPSRRGHALVGDDLRNTRTLVDSALSLTQALQAETNAFFGGESHGDANAADVDLARNIVTMNLRRIEINLTRSSHIINDWHDRGTERLRNNRRLRSEYSRLLAALRRSRQLGIALHRAAAHNAVVTSYDGQVTTITTTIEQALTELRAVVGSLRRPRPH